MLEAYVSNKELQGFILNQTHTLGDLINFSYEKCISKIEKKTVKNSLISGLSFMSSIMVKKRRIPIKNIKKIINLKNLLYRPDIGLIGTVKQELNKTECVDMFNYLFYLNMGIYANDLNLNDLDVHSLTFINVEPKPPTEDHFIVEFVLDNSDVLYFMLVTNELYSDQHKHL